MKTSRLVKALQEAEQDFEWYPTTRAMVDVVLADVRDRVSRRDYLGSILDIGAGDGRVLAWLAEAESHAKLYAIEKAPLLLQQQPDDVIPVGTEFFEQDLMALPVGVVFCNPPYSEFEEWASRIINTAHADVLYLIVPQRWESSALIAGALQGRGVKADVLHTTDFHDAERRARVVVHILRITLTEDDGRSYHRRKQDPFDVWFDQNIDTFDREAEPTEDDDDERRLARIRLLSDIPSMVDAFNEDYARMEANYRAIFKLDHALLKELGVDKASVREGLKKRMAGLKNTYWRELFDRLDAITSRLTTNTKKHFLDRLTGQTAIAFTEQNAYAIVLWAIKAANKYFDAQLTALFLKLSTHDGVTNYKSNLRTWTQDRWRYADEGPKHTHYMLDYRVVLDHYHAIKDVEFGAWDYPGDLHTSCHEVIDDLRAVFGNLGFLVRDVESRRRHWMANAWQNFYDSDGRVVFQVKAFKNGNLHFRFDQTAIKALNIEAGRLLGWLRGPADAVAEMDVTPIEAAQFFGASHRYQLGASSVRLLNP